EHEHIAGLQGDGCRVRRYEHLRPHGANEHVAGIGRGDFAGRDEAHLTLLVHPGVVLRDLPRLAVADEIAARIADVRDYGLVVAQGTGDDRCSYLLAVVLRVERAIVHGRIGVL